MGPGETYWRTIPMLFDPNAKLECPDRGEWWAVTGSKSSCYLYDVATVLPSPRGRTPPAPPPKHAPRRSKIAVSRAIMRLCGIVFGRLTLSATPLQDAWIGLSRYTSDSTASAVQSLRLRDRGSSQRFPGKPVILRSRGVENALIGVRRKPLWGQRKKVEDCQ
jgi:hypothetical protein